MAKAPAPCPFGGDEAPPPPRPTLRAAIRDALPDIDKACRRVIADTLKALPIKTHGEPGKGLEGLAAGGTVEAKPYRLGDGSPEAFRPFASGGVVDFVPPYIIGESPIESARRKVVADFEAYGLVNPDLLPGGGGAGKVLVGIDFAPRHMGSITVFDAFVDGRRVETYVPRVVDGAIELTRASDSPQMLELAGGVHRGIARAMIAAENRPPASTEDAELIREWFGLPSIKEMEAIGMLEDEAPCDCPVCASDCARIVPCMRKPDPDPE